MAAIGRRDTRGNAPGNARGHAKKGVMRTPVEILLKRSFQIIETGGPRAPLENARAKARQIRQLAVSCAAKRGASRHNATTKTPCPINCNKQLAQ